MPIPTEIQIVPLDFDTTRAELRRFLQNQDALKDYNFAGSAISTLLDILAYDAYYHGWYTNFAVNESFLQTAQVRNSVVAAARQVGYVPRSATAAVAVVDVTVQSVNSADGAITIPRYTRFESTLAGNTYNFYTIRDYSARVENNATTVSFPSVEIYEGTSLEQSFTVTQQQANTTSTFTLLNQDIDTRTITVQVRLDQASTTSVEYTRAQSALALTGNSYVYFLNETNEGTYEIQFGDGILGRRLTTNQFVSVRYLNTRGSLGNSANNFSYKGASLGYLSQTQDVVVSLTNPNVPSYGGAARESIDSIKRNAPSIYQTQGRVVTPSDVRATILSEFGGIDSVSVWGGETHNPPTYGKIFVAMKPVNAERFGPTQKQYVLEKLLRPRSLPTVTFEFVDPDYVYLVIDTRVRYTPALTGLSDVNIRDIVTNAIIRYAEDELGQFGSFFRYSQLMFAIDRSDASIFSNLTTVRLEKRFTVSPGRKSYLLSYGDPLYDPGVSANVVTVSSLVGTQRFTHPDQLGILRRDCYVENVGTVLHVYRTTADDQRLLTRPNVGTINFESGLVQFTDFAPTQITTSQFNQLRLRAIPSDSDLVPARDQIILVPRENITVSVVDDLTNRSRTTTGIATAGGQLGAGGIVV